MYVDKMIEIYFKTKDNIIAKFGRELFRNKIAETMKILPDGKSLLKDNTNVSVDSNGDERESFIGD